MAVLNKIRQRSIFLIIIIALALFSFIIGDIFQNLGSSGKSQTVVATINGEDIERDAFMNQVENVQKQSRGSVSNTQAMNRVWDQEVRNKVMQTQFDAVGISIERDYMRQLLKQNLGSFEEFKNDLGLFDENKLNEFIANLKAIQPETTSLNGSPINYAAWTNFEVNVAASGKEQMYTSMVKAGLVGTLADGEQNYKLENDKVDIKFIQIPFSSIPDSMITVTKSDVKKYINEHKEKYEVGEKAEITFPSGSGGRALLSIENGTEVLSTQWIETKKGETKASIALTKEMTPNVYINISTFLKGGKGG